MPVAVWNCAFFLPILDTRGHCKQFSGLWKIVARSNLVILYSFWHSVIPTSHFIFTFCGHRPYRETHPSFLHLLALENTRHSRNIWSSQSHLWKGTKLSACLHQRIMHDMPICVTIRGVVPPDFKEKEDGEKSGLANFCVLAKRCILASL